MAKILYGGGVADMRGKEAGSVHSRNTYGSYTRQKVSPVQPRTNAQLLVRTQLATVAQAWRGLTQAQMASWNLIAPTYSRTNVFGNRTPLTGFNLFGMLNRMRQVLGLELITVPPVPLAVSGVAALALAVDTGAPTYTITFTPTPLPADMYGVIYCTPGLSPGISFPGNNTRVVGVAAPAQTSPYEIHVDYSAIFGPLVLGLKYYVQVQIVHGLSGIASALNQASAIAT